MAKIIKSGKGDTKRFSIVGLKTEEFFTLLDILDDSLYEAAKNEGKYSEEKSKRIIHLEEMLDSEFRNPIIL